MSVNCLKRELTVTKLDGVLRDANNFPQVTSNRMQFPGRDPLADQIAPSSMRFSKGLNRWFPVMTDDERSNTPWQSSIKSRRVQENFRPFADPVNSRLVLIVAGEASADLHGSHLVTALKRLDPGLTFWGIGGPRLQEAGVRILFNSSDMAVVGLTEVVSRLTTITRAYLTLKTILRKDRPVLLILMDYPDFNLRLARAAKRFQVPVLYYISPQVWAWRKGRVETIRNCVDRMAVILPLKKTFTGKRTPSRARGPPSPGRDPHGSG